MPLAREGLLAKFSDCVGDRLPATQADVLFDAMMVLETASDLRALPLTAATEPRLRSA